MKPLLLPFSALLLLAPLAGCQRPTTPKPLAETGPTTITITPEVLHPNVKRLGINLSGQTFYDSGQMLRNLTFRNPGFEGETWQSILHCKTITINSCTDENQYAQWPGGFLDGARYTVLSGPAHGRQRHSHKQRSRIRQSRRHAQLCRRTSRPCLRRLPPRPPRQTRPGRSRLVERSAWRRHPRHRVPRSLSAHPRPPGPAHRRRRIRRQRHRKQLFR